MLIIEALKSLKNIVIQSFYRNDLYKDVAYKWTGYGQKYLLILCLTMSLPMAFYAAMLLDDIYDIVGNILQIHDGQINNTTRVDEESARFIHDLLIQLPDFYIKNNKITANQDQKLSIQSNFTKKDIILINTDIRSKPDTHYIININHDSMTFGGISIDLSSQIHDIDIILTQEVLFKYIRNFYKASISSYFSLILASTLYFIITIYFKLVVNVIGLFILNKISLLNLSKEAIFRLIAVSASPAIVTIGFINLIAFLGYSLFRLNLMSAGFINFQNQLFTALSLGYLFFGFITIRQLRK